jgi:hypothetical protein
VDPAPASLGTRASNLLFGPETGARLVIVQGLFVALMGLRIALSPFRGLSPQPPALWRPVPFLELLDRMPSRSVIVALQVLGVIAASSWFALGRADRWRGPGRRVTFAVVWLCLIVLVGLRASRGKILHNDLLMIWCAVPLLFAAGRARLSDRTPSRSFGWPIRTAIVLMATMYFLTGYWKLRNTGIEWVFSDNLRWALYGATKAQAREVGLYIANQPWLSVVSAAWILGYELTFPVVVFVRWLRPLYVVGAWVLHVGTFLIMGLDYWIYATVVTVLLIDWPRVVDRVRPRSMTVASAGV